MLPAGNYRICDSRQRQITAPLPNVKRFWMILAGAGIIVAAVFLVRGNIDAAFVAAALGAVAWFLSYRTTMREITTAADDEAADKDHETEFDDDVDNK
jgi:Flp pilus assembly protein TadB